MGTVDVRYRAWGHSITSFENHRRREFSEVVMMQWFEIGLQVLQVLDEASRDRCRTCTRFDPLYRIMEVLSDPSLYHFFLPFWHFSCEHHNLVVWMRLLFVSAVRRVVVIDPNSRHVEGIITLRDVFNLLLGWNFS